MKLSLRLVLVLLNLPMFACVCAYDYEKESETRRTVNDSDPCPSPDAVASDEGAVDVELLSTEQTAQTPLCWYKLDVELRGDPQRPPRTGLGRCSPIFEPFEPFEKVRERLNKASVPNGTYAGFTSAAIRGKGMIVCTEDQGPVVVWQSDKETCDPTPDTSTWDGDVESFWSGGMVVEELLATDQRPTLKACIYEVTTEHHKPSCTSSNYWW